MNPLQLLKENRADIGSKPVHAIEERRVEAARLTALLNGKRAFSFVRLGDYDAACLLAAEKDVPSTFLPHEKTISGTTGMGSPGLEPSQMKRLRAALESADYLDRHEMLWRDGKILELLNLNCVHGSTRNPNFITSYILPTWLEYEFKNYCRSRRVLFCGAEAPLLEEMLKHSEYRKAAKVFWPENCEAFFLRPRENGRNLASNLDLIKQELKEAIERWNINTLFLSLGGGAKILCCELARELGICAIDFGAFLRSLTYSGSDGNRASRATHTVFLFRVPFGLYMTVLEKTFPDLTPEELLAKAHAQLLLEIQTKEVGWSHSAWEDDFSDENVSYFRNSFVEYKRRYHHLFNYSQTAKKERADFLHFCGTHNLTTEGRLFMAKFRAKSTLRRILSN